MPAGSSSLLWLLPSGLSCVPVLPPRRGSFYVDSGTGVSVGSALTFWCREGYQLVGSEKIYCDVRNGQPQWSSYLPVCEGEQGAATRRLLSFLNFCFVFFFILVSHPQT